MTKQFLGRYPGVTIFGKSPVTEYPVDIPNDVITQIACGDKHCLIVCESGRVFGFGDNSEGQCGVDPKHGKIIKSPTFVESLAAYEVVQVASGAHSSFFVTSNGELFVCGSNKMGELGLGHKRPCALPVRIGHSLNVASVSAASYHFMVITDAGKVYVCGDNRLGQLGLGHRRTQTSLTDVEFPEVIKKVICGESFNVALSTSGKLYTTEHRILENKENGGDEENEGDEENKSDEGNGKENYFYPISSIDQEVVDVACGSCHSIMLLTDGTVWGFGGNSCGQLGTNNVLDSYESLVKSTVPDHLSVGSLFASMYRSALISKEGDVWLWGEGNSSILPAGQSTDILTKPMIVNKALNVMGKQVDFCDEFTVVWCKFTPKFESRKRAISFCLTESEEVIMALMECPVCCYIMIPPIYMCLQGHNLCSMCKEKVESCPQCRSEFGNDMNESLELMCMEVGLPCKQCSEIMLVDYIVLHFTVCPARQRFCPLSKGCKWRGKTRNILKHISKVHAANVWYGSPHTFEFSVTEEELETRAWVVNDNIFIVYWKYDGETTQLKVAAKLIGAHSPPKKHKLELKFVEDNKNFKTIMSGIMVDTDCVKDIFNCVGCTMKTHLCKNVCRVAILERDELDELFEQFETVASMSVNE